MFKEYMQRDVPATGGLLFIVTSVFLAAALMYGVTLARETTSRSVAKSVEQEIAIQCLASCYINNLDPDDISGDTKSFPSLAKNGEPIVPLDQFNNAMHSYNLMSKNSEATDIYMEYTGGPTTDPRKTTFTLQIGSYDSFADTAAFGPGTIYPDPVKTVIEEK